MVGYTQGSLYAKNAGKTDVFAAKYDSAGRQVWARQMGAIGRDFAYGGCLDDEGNLYIVGQTDGNLYGRVWGQEGRGHYDAFVVKLSSTGSKIWARQFGAVDKSNDRATGVTTDARGDVVVAGYTAGYLFGRASNTKRAFRDNGFVVKYTSAGALVWAHQFAGEDGILNAVAVDARRSIYVCGIAQTSGNDQARLSKLRPDGVLIWQRLVGGNHSDAARGVCVDPRGNSYIVGYFGLSDLGVALCGFVAKYDSSGRQVRLTRLGSTPSTAVYGCSLDANGNLYVVGETNEALFGASSGHTDAFAAQYDPNGVLLWSTQFGTRQADSLQDVAIGQFGVVMACGTTMGDLYGKNAGESDVFVRQLRP